MKLCAFKEFLAKCIKEVRTQRNPTVVVCHAGCAWEAPEASSLTVWIFSTGWRQGWSICVLLEVHRRFLGTPKVQEMFSAMVDVIWMWESWAVAD